MWQRLACFPLVVAPAACSGPLSTLDPAGPSASLVANLWWGMFAAAALIMLAVCLLWWYAVRRSGEQQLSAVDAEKDSRIHQHLIVGGGLALPIVSIVLLLVVGIPAGHRMLPLSTEGADALVIEVTGHQWWWQVTYPEAGIQLVDELHVPVGQALDIRLTSADVIHSFWVPRLGGKLDLVPGHVNTLRLQADAPGQYRGVCAEFCGLNHTHMTFVVHVHEEDDYQRWLEAQ